jgi:hypothetical protein
MEVDDIVLDLDLKQLESVTTSGEKRCFVAVCCEEVLREAIKHTKACHLTNSVQGQVWLNVNFIRVIGGCHASEADEPRIHGC